MEKDIVNIGKSVVIKGELNGSEDLTIEGHVEGTIQLKEHVLTIGPNGRIKAQVFAKSVIVLGEVTGNVTASDKVDIRDNGSVDGDIISPRVAIAEGAHFRGSVDSGDELAAGFPKTRDEIFAYRGDIISPRVAIGEGAHFRGSVDMQRKGGAAPQAQAAKPAAPQGQAVPQGQAQGQPAAGAPQRVGA